MHKVYLKHYKILDCACGKPSLYLAVPGISWNFSQKELSEKRQFHVHNYASYLGKIWIFLKNCTKSHQTLLKDRGDYNALNTRS